MREAKFLRGKSLRGRSCLTPKFKNHQTGTKTLYVQLVLKMERDGARSRLGGRAHPLVCNPDRGEGPSSPAQRGALPGTFKPRN